MVVAADLIGTSERIAEQLYAHAGFREATEVVFALPFGFGHQGRVQILTGMTDHRGPVLGWSPTA